MTAGRVTLLAMAKTKAFSPEKRRSALRVFISHSGHSVNSFAKKAGISEGTLRNFLKGGPHGSESMSDRTYSLLAEAAGVPVAQLMGEDPRSAGGPQAASHSLADVLIKEIYDPAAMPEGSVEEKAVLVLLRYLRKKGV